MPFDMDNLNGFGPSKRNSSTKVTLPKALAETGMALPRVIKAARRFRPSIFDGFIRESWFPSSLSPLHSQAAGSWSLDHGGHGTTSTRPFDPVMLVKTMQFPPPKREKNELAIKFLSWFLGSKSGGFWLLQSKKNKLMGMLTYHINCCSIIEFTIGSVSVEDSYFTQTTWKLQKPLTTEKVCIPRSLETPRSLESACLYGKMVRHKSDYHVFVKCWTVGHAPKYVK